MIKYCLGDLMNRKEIILHRKSNNEDCRKYEEEYVQYFYMLKEPVDIRCGHIYFEEINIEDLSENEIIISVILTIIYMWSLNLANIILFYPCGYRLRLLIKEDKKIAIYFFYRDIFIILIQEHKKETDI